ncbi:Collagen alpha-3 (VI) chain [Gossypium arboreum]|uniref:Collagen alpha-3 (VI) chain n=1 Tax=Gossypium arboreum TaxID=29729 RepID=A0A0B0PIY4_GOSAR|nr:Collagen alpha-3 (VI) chain [Gossypium arboreum]
MCPLAHYNLLSCLDAIITITHRTSLNYPLNTRNTIRYIGSLHLSALYVANSTSYLRSHVVCLRASHGSAYAGCQVSITHVGLPRHQ